jgi:hypothetical protein
MLICLTSPYARRGESWKAFQKHYGREDSSVLFVKAATRVMNPEVPQGVVDAAYTDDPAHASAEFGAEFRTDIESFISHEAVAACVVPGRLELPPVLGRAYVAFVDPAGGSGGDSMTLAIAHRTPGRIVVDCLREERPPFSPDDVCGSFADTLRRYRVSMIHGDRYAGEWPRERLRKHGISYRIGEATKSELYQALLPNLNAGTIELLDHERCRKQVLALERRTARGGRDSIDHPSGGHDDVINAVAGVAYLLRGGREVISMITVADEEARARETARLIGQSAQIGAALWQRGAKRR